MSSPGSLRYSQADFLARWMPSSTRAGVILNPCPDLAGAMRHTSALGSPSSPLGPDDSFASEFAPLPASADSSCVGVDGFTGERPAADRPVNGLSSVPRRRANGEVDGLDEMAHAAQDLPLRIKLEQLRKWQQHMQQQLKAHQLEELLRLQEEQQRLLGMMNGAQDGTEETQSSPTSPSPTCGLVRDQQQELRRGQYYEEEDDEEEGSWHSTEEDQSVDSSQFHNDTVVSRKGDAEDRRAGEDEALQDRPIKPGIGGQKKTFEELLEEQLKLEEQRLKAAHQQKSQHGAAAAQAPLKRAFLRRGEGLSRYRKPPVSKPEVRKDPRPQQQTRGLTRSNSEPTAVLRGGSNGVQKLPVQRKTATLNKENRLKGVCSPPQDVRARTKVLGSHQRHNTDPQESTKTDSESRQTTVQLELYNRKECPSLQRSTGLNMNAVTKQVGLIPQTERAQTEGRSCASKEESGGEAPQDSFEMSFQEKLQRWDCDRQIESIELGEFELLEQAAEELSFSSNSSFVLKVLQMDQYRAAKGLPPRRLSSTPIKSPPKLSPRRCSSLDGGGAVKSSAVNPEVVKSREVTLSRVNDRRLDSETKESSDVSSISGSEEEVTVDPPSFPGALRFPAQSDQPYDKHSYQDEDSCRDDGDESTLLEDKSTQQGRVVFDDDDTWNDLEDAAVCSANGSRGVSPVCRAERTLQRKVAVSKGAEADKGSANQEPPPASQLMTRLFPSLKPKTQNAPLPPPPLPPAESKQSEDAGQQAQSRQLRERLVELEIEIERFKKENAALTKLRQENEKNQENLRKERLEFEKMKAEEVAKFEEHKKEENRKLQKERKLFEKHALAARAIPDKKEREEIQALKQQLISLQEELRSRENRWTSTHNRLRQQIDSLNQENSSLRDEVRMLEKLRLTALKKSQVTAEKACPKDGPRMFDNVSTVPKGVKFASPLDSRGSSSSSSPPFNSSAPVLAKTSRESSQAAAGMKSSLRKPPAPLASSSSSSSSAAPGRRKEEKSTEAPFKSRDKPPEKDRTQNVSSKPESPPKDSEAREVEEPEAAKEVVTHPDGKVETVLLSGDRLICFPNGTKKEVSADGQTVKVTFFNGDTKQVTADQRVIYFYAEAQTTHITYPDGIEVLHFPNNQTEKHFPDGRKEITFPDQTIKNLFPNGREESVLTDGTIIQVNPDGTKEIHFNTGQREIHTADYKRREYPDGTVKTVYTDGRQETSYPSGRLRVKDKDGNVILDNRV